jgi:hypothetical protein
MGNLFPFEVTMFSGRSDDHTARRFAIAMRSEISEKPSIVRAFGQ